MDRGPLQEVDVREGLESTLMILRHKLGNVAISRDYDPQLPRIAGHGSELNQVWTNLIDNAIDAMAGEGHSRYAQREPRTASRSRSPTMVPACRWRSRRESSTPSSRPNAWEPAPGWGSISCIRS